MRWDEIAEGSLKISRTEIHTKCSEMTSLYNSSPRRFYRGERSSLDNFMAVPRQNRISLNSPPFLQEMVDEWLVNHGFVALRSNSIFVTSDMEFAKIYGNPYIIYPEDGFSFTWFENIQDFSKHLFNGKTTNLASIARGRDNIETLNNIKSLTLQDVIDRGISEASMRERVDRHMNAVSPSRTNLAQALQSGNEVMISCSRYYAFSAP